MVEARLSVPATPFEDSGFAASSPDWLAAVSNGLVDALSAADPFTSCWAAALTNGRSNDARTWLYGPDANRGQEEHPWLCLAGTLLGELHKAAIGHYGAAAQGTSGLFKAWQQFEAALDLIGRIEAWKNVLDGDVTADDLLNLVLQHLGGGKPNGAGTREQAKGTAARAWELHRTRSPDASRRNIGQAAKTRVEIRTVAKALENHR